MLRFRWANRRKPMYKCPVCGYSGPFRDWDAPTGYRENARCPSCGARERHRLQVLVMQQLAREHDFAQMSMIHFSPSPFLRGPFGRMFGQYTTADLEGDHVDHNADLQDLPFEDGSYDVVFASHVLEHIAGDRKALAEIRRILRDGGFAVLPVPVIAPETVEYPEPNTAESEHVRAAGPDYFDRYEALFSRVRIFRSDEFPEQYQLFLHEDRSARSVPGKRHLDFVPVCYV
ncbi:MAG: methyltransferase domain-containing protein [Lentisphaerae bacterium]|nr:methyltransferase domain-containing protein [Lentisphaerota bacterium]